PSPIAPPSPHRTGLGFDRRAAIGVNSVGLALYRRAVVSPPLDDAVDAFVNDTTAALNDLARRASVGRKATLGQDAVSEAFALAYAICAVAEQPSGSELQALDRFRAMMLGTLERCRVSHPITGVPVRTATPPAETAAADPAPRAAAAASNPADAVEAARPLEDLLAELDGLVGLGEVKTEIRQVANLIAVQ